MYLDDGFIAMLAGGIGLSIASLIAEYLRWRAQGASERRRELRQRELHAARLAQQDTAPVLPSVAEPAEVAAGAPERRTARHVSRHISPFIERRKRAGSRD
jgi:hypothetical protein